MRTAVKFLGFSSGFSLVVAAVYWFLAYERAGSVLLLFMFMAPLLVAAWLALRAWRSRRSEDDPEAEHGAVAGTLVGRFAGATVWPFVMAIGAAIALEGFVYGVWLLVPGLVTFAWAALGLVSQSRS